MEVQPIKRYTADKYPTRDILDTNPELLRVTPRRWQTNAAVLTALTTAGLLLAARTGGQAAAQASNIAPIFQHGEGRGTYGCMAVNPPVFLSEEDARLVIAEEAKTAGIVFTADSLSLPKAQLPVTSRGWGEEKNAGEQVTTGDLQLDGWDQTRKIGFEYVSRDDYTAWAASSLLISSVTSYNMLDAAQRLQAGLAQSKPVGAYAVFYDPMASASHVYGKYPGRLPSGRSTRANEFTETTLAPVTIFLIGDDGKRTEENGHVSFSCAGHRIQLTLDSAEVIIDEKTVMLAAPVVVRHGMPYVPLQSFAKEVGVTVRWDQQTGIVTLHMPNLQFEPTSGLVTTTEKDPAKRQTLAFADYDWEGRENVGRDAAREQLRQQVKDFIGWLKTQGVI